MATHDLYEALAATTRRRTEHDCPVLDDPAEVPAQGLTREQTVALMEELRDMERIAAKALEAVRLGGAKTGTSALTKLRAMASDSRRWAETHLDRNQRAVA